jgi:hypothetical protein
VDRVNRALKLFIMGEYAKFNGESIKIGTCEMMYYLRYEDRHKVTPESNSLNPHTVKNLFWRLPFPDEDHIQPGHYENHNRGIRLNHPSKGDFKVEGADNRPGMIQLVHKNSGLLANIKCYHGMKLPENSKEVRFGWNGMGHSFELIGIKNADDEIRAVYHCRHCQSMWSSNDWDEVLDYIQCSEMKRRLECLAENKDISVK